MRGWLKIPPRLASLIVGCPNGDGGAGADESPVAGGVRICPNADFGAFPPKADEGAEFGPNAEVVPNVGPLNTEVTSPNALVVVPKFANAD